MALGREGAASGAAWVGAMPLGMAGLGAGQRRPCTVWVLQQSGRSQPDSESGNPQAILAPAGLTQH